MAVSKIFMQCNLEVNIRSSKRILKSKINNNVKGKIQVFLIGGPNFGSERTVDLFLANYFSHRRSRVLI